MFQDLNIILKFYFIFIVLIELLWFLIRVYNYKYVLYFITHGLIPDGPFGPSDPSLQVK